MVKRFEPIADQDGAYAYMVEAGKYGDWVRYEDYQELSRLLDSALQEIEYLQDEIESLRNKNE